MVQLKPLVDNFEKSKLAFTRWWLNTSILYKLLFSFSFTILTGILSQMKIYLPWTPVPITGQTIGVLLAGVVLKKNWGAMSQIIYVSLGVLGVPWFASNNSGVSSLMGPTGGYLIGFIVAAFFVGWIVEKYLRSKNGKFIWVILGLLFANFVIIYACGLMGLTIWMNLIQKSTVSFLKVLKIGMIPFVIGDLLKIVLVSMISALSLPIEGGKEHVITWTRKK